MLFTLCLFLSPQVQSAQKKEDYNRLNLLRQATGNPNVAANGFEARVNSILDRTPDAERSSLARRTDSSGKAQVQVLPEVPAPKQSKTPKTPGTSQMDQALIQKKQDSGQVDTFVDNSEEAYRALLQEKKDKAKEEEKEKISKAKSLQAVAESKTGDLSPSLANNPFYFKPSTDQDPIKKFEANKSVLVSRLVAAGYIPEDAESIVAKASAPEDIVLTLMENQGMSYGEANDLTNLDNESLPLESSSQGSLSS